MQISWRLSGMSYDGLDIRVSTFTPRCQYYSILFVRCRLRECGFSKRVLGKKE